MQFLPLGLSIFRYILTLVGGYFVTKGVISNDVVTALGGTVPAVVSLIGSVLTHAPVKVSDVTSVVSQVADTVGSITKDGQTKDVLKQVKDILNAVDLEDKAKGNIG